MTNKTQISLLAKKILGDNEFRNLLKTNPTPFNIQDLNNKNQKAGKIEKLPNGTQPKLQTSLNTHQLWNYQPQRYTLGDYSSDEKHLINSRLNQLLPMESDLGEEINTISNLHFLDNFNSTNPKHTNETNVTHETNEPEINLSTQKYLEQLSENLGSMKQKEEQHNNHFDLLLQKVSKNKNTNLMESNKVKQPNKSDRISIDFQMCKQKENKNLPHQKEANIGTNFNFNNKQSHQISNNEPLLKNHSKNSLRENTFNSGDLNPNLEKKLMNKKVVIQTNQNQNNNPNGITNPMNRLVGQLLPQQQQSKLLQEKEKVKGEEKGKGKGKEKEKEKEKPKEKEKENLIKKQKHKDQEKIKLNKPEKNKILNFPEEITGYFQNKTLFSKSFSKKKNP
ncbi:hypothetical protein M0812_01875 [Anaeramoeba flamelloides]|uniref:Uncharacterized protein n=1 Tax=Anaeramoeba flamelloides TaxID=1746091 RepID=A0AAV7Z551_9EUKA|nr:hypothetical protein M0812_01875 [Anaeramoeba flamelloides]